MSRVNEVLASGGTKREGKPGLAAALEEREFDSGEGVMLWNPQAQGDAEADATQHHDLDLHLDSPASFC